MCHGQCRRNTVWRVHAVLCAQVPILGVAVNKVPARDLAISKSQLQQR